MRRLVKDLYKLKLAARRTRTIIGDFTEKYVSNARVSKGFGSFCDFRFFATSETNWKTEKIWHGYTRGDAWEIVNPKRFHRKFESFGFEEELSRIFFPFRDLCDSNTKEDKFIVQVQLEDAGGGEVAELPKDV